MSLTMLHNHETCPLYEADGSGPVPATPDIFVERVFNYALELASKDRLKVKEDASLGDFLERCIRK